MLLDLILGLKTLYVQLLGRRLERLLESLSRRVMKKCLECNRDILQVRRTRFCSEICRHRNNKRTAVDFLYGLKRRGCSQCTERRPSCLQFHHTDPSIKKFNLSAARGKSLDDIKEEAAKCIVLCANCHFVEEYGDGHRPDLQSLNFIDSRPKSKRTPNTTRPVKSKPAKWFLDKYPDGMTDFKSISQQST